MIFLGLLVVMIWGFTFVVVKIGLEDISPLLLGCSRFFLTSIPAVFFIKKPAVPFRMVIFYGLVMFALQFALLFIGIHEGVSAGMASLLLQLQVFFSMLLACVFFKEKLLPSQVFGALISFSGIAVVGMNINGETRLNGVLLVVLAALFWGAGNMISKRIGKVNMLSLVVWSSLVAWPPLLIASLMIDGADSVFTTFQNLSWQSGGAIIYITYLSTIFGFGVWNWLLNQYPLGRIAPLTFLVPVFGMLSSILVLDEHMHSWKILAALLVIAGLSINFFGARIFDKKSVTTTP